MNLTDIDDFLLESPLYEKYYISEDDKYNLYNLIFYSWNLDSHCPDCGSLSTFTGVDNNPDGFRTQYKLIAPKNYDEFESRGFRFSDILNKVYTINLNCARNKIHKMKFIILVTHDTLIKIGQYPSIAETSQPELKKYRKALSEERYKEFNRGIGLFTHGIGIGAFVYLRRIFEEQIDIAYSKAKNDQDWDDTAYHQARVTEKIDLLKKELPEFLVTNKNLYGILSKGIHELSESECLEYFPIVKTGIEFILDEILEKKEKEKKQAETQRLIQKLSTNLGKK